MAKRAPWVIIDLMTGDFVRGSDGKPLRFLSQAAATMWAKPGQSVQFRR